MTEATLKHIRKDVLGISQVEFAALLGVSRRTYIRYEHTGAPLPVLKLANRMMHDKPKRKPLRRKEQQ
jgi:DNA-binding XRE family transcriptional regulator